MLKKSRGKKCLDTVSLKGQCHDTFDLRFFIKVLLWSHWMISQVDLGFFSPPRYSNSKVQTMLSRWGKHVECKQISEVTPYPYSIRMCQDIKNGGQTFCEIVSLSLWWPINCSEDDDDDDKYTIPMIGSPRKGPSCFMFMTALEYSTWCGWCDSVLERSWPAAARFDSFRIGRSGSDFLTAWPAWEWARWPSRAEHRPTVKIENQLKCRYQL